MIFRKGKITGSYIIDIEKYSDERGFFARGYCDKEFEAQGISFDMVQANIGFSMHKHTIRGLHYQTAPHAEAKLVRCTKGALFDVIVDLRKDSPTYREWTGIELTPENRTMFYVPEGCAHGYQTLKDETEIFYMVSAFYAPEYEHGLRWNDPVFNIQWKENEDIIISNKDQNWPNFSDSIADSEH